MFLGGCPYPKIQAHRIPYMIKDNYRMPKPAHLDDEMWVKWFIDVIIIVVVFINQAQDVNHLCWASGEKKLPRV